MPSVVVPEVGNVEIKRSKQAKRLILAIKPDGTPRLTLPYYVPLALGKRYLVRHTTWLQRHAGQHQTPLFKTDSLVGRDHRLEFKLNNRLHSRVGKNTIIVYLPPGSVITDPVVQTEARRASTRAVRRQAEAYLPGRLHQLAQKHSYSYREVRCKNLSTRWGSCSTNQVINLNIWLMQLPKELIDYVLLHELTHLPHQHHQAAFWQELGAMEPAWQQRRRQLKDYRPSLQLQA